MHSDYAMTSDVVYHKRLLLKLEECSVVTSLLNRLRAVLCVRSFQGVSPRVGGGGRTR